MKHRTVRIGVCFAVAGGLALAALNAVAESAAGVWRYSRTTQEDEPSCPPWGVKTPNCFEVGGTFGRVDKGGYVSIKSDRTSSGGPVREVSFSFNLPSFPTTLKPDEVLSVTASIARSGVVNYKYGGAGRLFVKVDRPSAGWKVAGIKVSHLYVPVDGDASASSTDTLTVPRSAPWLLEADGVHRMAIVVTAWGPAFAKTLRHIYEYDRGGSAVPASPSTPATVAPAVVPVAEAPGWATGTALVGSAVSANGQRFPCRLLITRLDAGSGALEGEIQWQGLGSVHKIVGRLHAGQLSFEEVAYIRKGRANLNVRYGGIVTAGIAAGDWVDPKGDHGVFELTLDQAAAPQPPLAPNAMFAGTARSGKSGETWPGILRIDAVNGTAGQFEGQLEWTSLAATTRVVGTFQGNAVVFKEVAFVKRGRVTLDTEYRGTVQGREINGTWSDPNGDQGSFTFRMR